MTGLKLGRLIQKLGSISSKGQNFISCDDMVNLTL